MCRYRQSDWHRERFFVVDVPGPAIAGLPSSKALHLVTIHTISQGPKLTDASGPIAAPGGHHTTQVRDIQDLKDRYPNQFDTLGISRHLPAYISNLMHSHISILHENAVPTLSPN